MEVDGLEEMTPDTELGLSTNEGGEEPSSTMGASATNKVLGASLPPRDKKSTSDVWDHFAKIINEESGKANNVRCMHCGVQKALEQLYEFYEQSFASSKQNCGGQSLSASSSSSNSIGNEASSKYDIQVWRRTYMLSKKKAHDGNKSELDPVSSR
ncbi:uncharacterized protein LOC125312868 [Rhodamnia argentea]|uniref:Uncharacterized protein LOC125312868 n=1 Tax=Rhodamnia argentea TaxID=178133 RepID=A0ABM3GW72_9MYRT|nr:uncharacterized protein LOC125312868 [Rhodamnia argentea]